MPRVETMGEHHAAEPLGIESSRTRGCEGYCGAMSREGIEIVRRAVELFARDGPEAVRDLLHPDIETFAQIGEVYRGRDGAVGFLREWLGPWEDYSIDVEECFDAGDCVVAFINQRGRGRGSAMEVDQRPAFVLRLSGRQIIECRFFVDRSQALQAAGLRE
jgi:ketosteroid isomerase-like protein